MTTFDHPAAAALLTIALCDRATRSYCTKARSLNSLYKFSVSYL
ncbi:hypothetical protein QUA42_19875 [Microcoleus sp. Pol11C2]